MAMPDSTAVVHAARETIRVAEMVRDTVVRVAMPQTKPYTDWRVPAIAAAAAILGGIIAQWVRAGIEDARAREQLVMRARQALEFAIGAANSILKRDEKRVIGPELLDGMIVNWERYDRVSDAWPLLHQPFVQEQVENILEFSRIVANQIKDSEIGIQKTARERGVLTKAGIELASDVLEGLYANRRQNRANLDRLRQHAQVALGRLDDLWSPPKGHVKPSVPESQDESASQLPSAGE